MAEEKTYADYFDEAIAAEDGNDVDDPEKGTNDNNVDQTPDENDDTKQDEDLKKDDDKNTGEEEKTGFVPLEESQDGDVTEEGKTNWEEKYNEAIAENQRLEHKMSSWQGRITKANQRADEAEKRIEALEKKLEKPSVDGDTSKAEGDVVLSEFMEEFPDLVEPIKRLASNIAEKIVSERLGTVTPQIEEIKKGQQQSAEDAFLAPITEAHPDWRSIYDSGKLQAWIDKQTPLQQKVLNTIVTDGSQAEVIEMFTSYKKANGLIKPNSNKPNPTGEQNPDLKNIQAVKHQSAGPPAGQPDKNDFDSAWKEATSS